VRARDVLGFLAFSHGGRGVPGLGDEVRPYRLVLGFVVAALVIMSSRTPRMLCRVGTAMEDQSASHARK
jgi:hypothetical protein